MKLRSEFRIEKDGERVFGKGPLILLEKIDELGSLNKASNDLQMSYSKGWSIIKRAEALLGYELLNTYTGGVDGGGSSLTPKARMLIRSYKDFCQEAEKILDELYIKYFGNI